MTEKEIVKYLKKNSEKGIAYFFLPDDVRDWVDKNTIDFKKSELLIFTKFGDWVKLREEDGIDLCDFDNFVFALPTHYEIPQRGCWVEFEITDNHFDFNDGNINRFRWFDWIDFLDRSDSKGWGFTAFGGWQYENNGAWYMQPMIFNVDENTYYDIYMEEEIKPAIPTKIRFWREAK